MATNRTRRFVNAVKLAVTDGGVHSGDPCLCGQMSGIVLEGKDTSNRAVVARAGAFRVSVAGVNDSGDTAIAAGEQIYYVSGDTPVLSAKTSGVFFGWAIEDVDSGQTQSVQVALSGGSMGAPSGGGGGSAASQLSIGVAGDGSDGAVHYTTNTTLAAPVNATTILVDAGVRVNTVSFDMRATESISNNGTIADYRHSVADTDIVSPGKDGYGGADVSRGGQGGAESKPAGGLYTAGKNGGDSNTTGGANGVAATGTVLSSGLNGGDGGTGDAGNNSGGTGGLTTDAFTAGFGINIHVGNELLHPQGLDAGAGGGAGAGDGSLLGGGGGAGGGYMVLIAPTITNTGTVECTGGNGGDGDPAGNCGGGGGGTGGVMISLGNWTGNDPDVSGGAGGAGSGTGTDGTAGDAGKWVQLS